MLLSEFWKVFLKSTQVVCACVSIALNSFLIILILFRSPKNLGSYKYLMIYISVFEVVYSVWDSVTEPTVLSYGPAFVVFRNFKHSMFGREESFFLVVVFCGLFGCSIAIFAVHFIYRYGAVTKKFRDRFLSGRKIYFLFIMPIVYGTWWTALCANFFRYNWNSDVFFRAHLLDAYDTRIEDLSYIIVLFYSADEHNEIHPDLSMFLAIGCMWFMIVIITSLFCVIFFGIGCYIQLTRALAATHWQSQVTRSLQQQLFQALVIQTFIPVVLMYIPIAILYAFPMFNVDIGFASSFIAVTVAIYPAIDPLPTMFIIKNYRKTLCKKYMRTSHPMGV